jgi:PAS domain S-box-containing protein
MREFRKWKEKYRRIIANMNLGLLEVDKSERITLLNQSFCEISGYTEDELIGKKWNELVAVESKEVLEERSANRKKGITILWTYCYK